MLGANSFCASPIGIHVFFGLIATGKSTLAQAWAGLCGLPYYNSDMVRKELAGLAPGTPVRVEFGEGIYGSGFSLETYRALREKAAADLVAGRSVVLDASFLARQERDQVRRLAVRHGAGTRFILCTCPEPEMRRRMAERDRDPRAVSDGRWEIYLEQKKRLEPPAADERDVVIINTDEPVARLLERLVLRLRSQ